MSWCFMPWCPMCKVRLQSSIQGGYVGPQGCTGSVVVEERRTCNCSECHRVYNIRREYKPHTPWPVQWQIYSVRDEGLVVGTYFPGQEFFTLVGVVGLMGASLFLSRIACRPTHI